MPMFGRRLRETHVIVIWDPSDFIKVRQWTLAYIATRLGNTFQMTVVKAKTVSLTAAAALRMCRKMYVNRAAVQWHRNCRPFGNQIGVIAIVDHIPRYGWRKSVSAAQNLNVHMHDLKAFLRGKLHGQNYRLHSSVNVEEAALTLKPIGWGQLLQSRPTFHSFTHLFRTLDKHLPLKYVVQRWHLELGLGLQHFSHRKDVDVLVNDYYAFKGITGARSVNTDLMREQNNAGLIRNTILISGHEIAFDVRYIGDGYNDPMWQSHILKHRRRHREGASGLSFHVPSDEDYYFTLLYHCLVQKTTVTNFAAKWDNYMKPLGLRLSQTIDARDILQRTRAAWNVLDKYMTLHQYSYTHPRDPNVQLHLHGRPATVVSTNTIGKSCTLSDADYGT